MRTVRKAASFRFLERALNGVKRVFASFQIDSVVLPPSCSVPRAAVFS